MTPRTVLITDTPSLLRGLQVTAALPAWPAMDPADTRIYAIDYGPVLGAATLTSATARATPPVTPLRCTTSGSVVSVVLSGGVDGTTARVEVTAFLSDGETDTRAVLLPIIAQGTLEGTPVAVSPTTTLDATPALIASIPVIGPAGSAANIQGTVLARNVLTGEACSFALTAVATQIGTPQVSVGSPSVTGFAPPASLSRCALTVLAAGNVLLVSATGLPGTTIFWTPNLQVTVA